MFETALLTKIGKKNRISHQSVNDAYQLPLFNRGGCKHRDGSTGADHMRLGLKSLSTFFGTQGSIETRLWSQKKDLLGAKLDPGSTVVTSAWFQEANWRDKMIETHRPGHVKGSRETLSASKTYFKRDKIISSARCTRDEEAGGGQVATAWRSKVEVPTMSDRSTHRKRRSANLGCGGIYTDTRPRIRCHLVIWHPLRKQARLVASGFERLSPSRWCFRSSLDVTKNLIKFIGYKPGLNRILYSALPAIHIIR